MSTRNRSFNNGYLVFFVSILIIFLFSAIVSAKVSVNPMNLNFKIQPGNSATKNITVVNTGDQPTEVNVTLIDWWRTPEGNLQFSAPGSRERSSADWIVYSPSNIRIQPGESQEITVEMSVPEGVRGDYWATFLVQETSQARGEEQVTTRVSINYVTKVFYLNPVTGEKSANLNSVKMASQDPLNFEVKCENTSASYLRLSGNLEVRDLQGETVRKADIAEFGLLPGASRILKIQTGNSSPPEPGQYYVIAVLDFGGEYLVQGGRPIEIEKKKEDEENNDGS